MAKTKSASKKSTGRKPARAGTARIKQLRAEMDRYAGSTRNIQWMDHLCYKVGGKLFAILGRDPDEGTTSMSIKCAPSNFAAMTKRKGVTQAPYLAKKKWIRIADVAAIPWSDLRKWVRDSYEEVVAGLPKAMQESLSEWMPSR